MQKINEKLEKQLEIEKKAVKLYATFIQKLEDSKIEGELINIRDGKLEHIRLVEEMSSMLKSYAPKIKIAKSKDANIEMDGFIDKFSSLFIMIHIDNYPQTIMNIIKELDKSCIYLSFNKVPKYTKKLLAEHGIEVKKIKFINCIKASGEDITVDPEDLTKMSIVLEDMMKKTKEDFFVLVDPISAFPVYHEMNKILRFVSFINSKAACHNSGIIWVSIDDENENALNNKVGQLCDKVMKI